MKKSTNYFEVMSLIRSLSEEEKNMLASEIMAKLGKESRENKEDKKHRGCGELIAESDAHRPDCPHCSAKASMGNIIKKEVRKGVRYYYCKACGRKFASTTGTTFARTRKDADTWRKFISLTLSGASITVCQEDCGLSRQTAFNWRHKILHVFEENVKSTKMSGNVEVDEMLLPLSYKGNHIQGAFGARKDVPGAVNDMPRKSYKRGTDNKSMSAKEKACVFCMVESGNKSFYAAVPGVGFMTEPMLEKTVGRHIVKESAMMLADNYKITRKYFEDKGYQHTILSSNTSDNPHDHKPEVKDGLHMQHVNAMHRHIRKFLAPYCGVSSKYLSHYMALFVWLKSIGGTTKQKKTMDKVSVARAATPDCYISNQQLRNRPAVPQCA